MLLFLHHHRHINCSIKVSPSSSSRNDSTKCTFKQHSGTYLRHHLLGGMCAMCLCCCAPKVASTIQCNKISAKGEGKKEERKKTGNDDEKLHFKCKEAIDRQKSVSIQSNTQTNAQREKVRAPFTCSEHEAPNKANIEAAASASEGNSLYSNRLIREGNTKNKGKRKKKRQLTPNKRNKNTHTDTFEGT